MEASVRVRRRTSAANSTLHRHSADILVGCLTPFVFNEHHVLVFVAAQHGDLFAVGGNSKVLDTFRGKGGKLRRKPAHQRLHPEIILLAVIDGIEQATAVDREL